MKILHVIPSISPLRGGPSTAVIAMAKALRDQGVDARILTTNDDGDQLNKAFPLGEWFTHQGVPVIAFDRWSPRIRLLREFAVSPSLSMWLARHIRDYQLLHVHAIFSYPSTSSMVIARNRGIPYIVRCIGQLSHWSLAQSTRRKNWMLRIVERKNLNGATALHYTSKAERDEARDLGLTPKSLILPLGVQRFESTRGDMNDSPTGEVCFLVLCRLHPKKQLENLIEALALMKTRRPDAKWSLRIAGSGSMDYEETLKSLVERHELRSHVCWLGFLEGEAKWRELRDANWYVLPSASENFGIAVIEALSVGTPVILSPQVAVAENVKACGAGLVGDCSPQNLESLLERALDSKSNEEMAEAAIRMVSTQFNWQSISQTLIHMYRQSIQKCTSNAHITS